MVKRQGLRLSRKLKNALITTAFILFTGLSFLALLSIVGNVLYHAMQPLITHVETFQIESNELIFALKELVLSLWLVLLALVISTPLALLTALLITEYRDCCFTSLIRLFVDVLAGMPGILAGLAVYGLALSLFQMPTSKIVLILVLFLFLMPKLSKGFAQVFNEIPFHYREAAYAIGANKKQVIFHILLPMTVRALSASVLLGAARTLGASAPLLLFGVGVHYLAVDIYALAVRGSDGQAADYALVLLLLLGVVFSIAAWFDRDVME
ncbi:ABC transporter permease subunit [Sulfoacidibacillus thermotolerans]|uniref:ABC transmembrane type-1 domain-containing protein n=1 Tax=Sulfoacidibacillus thermotolerans TaxID=1765684 RepID=A0A2U3D9H4_SULT2|nr:ABC transporter permease subunit [Sulfoacidibacillus thermotolerans]PWI57921.1 hypothetical protein BM613_05755 [Sulfoacidibacillus thermotolerans]